MNKYTIITLKKKGKSFRAIANELGIDQKTVSKTWYQYIAAEESLLSTSTDLSSVEQNYITEKIIGDIKYDTSSRVNIKLTQEVQKKILECLEEEKEKNS